MSQTIRRKPAGIRRVAAQQGKAQKIRAAKARTGSALDAVMGWLPFSEEQLHKLFLVLILLAALVLAIAVASSAGLGMIAARQLGTIATQTGFAVRRVDVRGVNHLDRMTVYERALSLRDQPMPFVDPAALRSRLLELPWVEDARVSRQWPDTLVVDVVERKPHAVLRLPDRLMLIDDQGHELEPVSPAQAGRQLVLSGPGAGQQVPALSALLEAAPALKPQVKEAEWVGNRRWNLTFGTGQVLALPEGDQAAAQALMRFARLDGTNRLLGGKVAAFDMRAADRIYLRVPGRHDEEMRDQAAQKASQAQAQAAEAKAKAAEKEKT